MLFDVDNVIVEAKDLNDLLNALIVTHGDKLRVIDYSAKLLEVTVSGKYLTFRVRRKVAVHEL